MVSVMAECEVMCVECASTNVSWIDRMNWLYCEPCGIRCGGGTVVAARRLKWWEQLYLLNGLGVDYDG